MCCEDTNVPRDSYSSNQSSEILEMSRIYLVCFLLAATIVMVKPKHLDNGPYQVCGKYLAHLLAITCDSKYNIANIHRRSITFSPLEQLMETSIEEADNSNKPSRLSNILMGKKEANTVLHFRRRTKRGVYDECCRKSCTYHELRNYCAPS